jgi:hypothetical protein
MAEGGGLSPSAMNLEGHFILKKLLGVASRALVSSLSRALAAFVPHASRSLSDGPFP